MPTCRNGSALLTVLWLTAALSAIGLAVASNVRGETERTSTGIDDTRAFFIARGAIEQAALHVLWRGYTDAAGQPLYYRNGQPVIALDFPAAEVTVDIIPEMAKLNLNTARPEDLLRLLAALGVPVDRATEITTAIIDWRSQPDPTRASPFDGYYLNQSPSFLPRHASFQEDEELLLTRGVTPGLYYGESLNDSQAGLRDCLSVYGSSWAVDVNSARTATLEAVGLSPEDARDIAQRRTIHPILDYQEMAAIQQQLGTTGQRLRIGGQTMFTLRATARLKQPDGKLSDLRRTVAALVQFYFVGNSKGKPAGFQVIRWFDRT